MVGRVEFKPGGKVGRIQNNLDSPRVTLRRIGKILEAHSRQAFITQQFGDETWPARAPVNVYGLLADFSGGASKPKDRRFDRRPALQDTRNLMRSITSALVSDHVVEVGTVVPYASVMQKGGKVQSVRITGDMQKRIWRWLKSSKGREHKGTLGWLLNRKFRDTQLEGEVPARPFIGITPEIRAEVLHELGVGIAEVGR